MKQCEAKTTKKAWSNPLAPMARCRRDSPLALEGEGGEVTRVCALHGKKLLEYGWTKVTP